MPRKKAESNNEETLSNNMEVNEDADQLSEPKVKKTRKKKEVIASENQSDLEELVASEMQSDLEESITSDMQSDLEESVAEDGVNDSEKLTSNGIEEGLFFDVENDDPNEAYTHSELTQSLLEEIAASELAIKDDKLMSLDEPIVDVFNQIENEEIDSSQLEELEEETDAIQLEELEEIDSNQPEELEEVDSNQPVDLDEVLEPNQSEMAEELLETIELDEEEKLNETQESLEDISASEPIEADDDAAQLTGLSDDAILQSLSKKLGEDNDFDALDNFQEVVAKDENLDESETDNRSTRHIENESIQEEDRSVTLLDEKEVDLDVTPKDIKGKKVKPKKEIPIKVKQPKVKKTKEKKVKKAKEKKVKAPKLTKEQMKKIKEEKAAKKKPVPLNTVLLMVFSVIGVLLIVIMLMLVQSLDNLQKQVYTYVERKDAEHKALEIYNRQQALLPDSEYIGTDITGEGNVSNTAVTATEVAIVEPVPLEPTDDPVSDMPLNDGMAKWNVPFDISVYRMSALKYETMSVFNNSKNDSEIKANGQFLIVMLEVENKSQREETPFSLLFESENNITATLSIDEQYDFTVEPFVGDPELWSQFTLAANEKSTKKLVFDVDKEILSNAKKITLLFEKIGEGTPMTLVVK